MNLIASAKNKTIESNYILLRPLTKSYVTPEYLRWLNSKVVNEFLESRFDKYTLKSLKDYVSFCEKDKNTFFFAIIDKSTQKHIGNIKLGPINWNHKFAEIGIMIGDKSYWGRGIATESINLIVKFGFSSLNLHKLTAGAYSNNIGSIRAFKKAKFFQEGIRKNHFRYKKKYVDYVILARFRDKKS